MLIHLALSNLHHGPADLFATQTFESYNSVLRESSVHPNQQSPGHNIATSFNTYHLLWLLLCGGFIFNKQLNICLHTLGP
ncbi:hypothetical protein CROQUDRAFT_53371 [Cronartium quercuum f. sp. fusiforme G11]|uniref:Uncharacterized protein n=1 Tax=Cronartium quercuum f. sp. fusiforme G11 TaxID=708437 RepID=A0A9P6T623_9BASI|nr:hypothetical protein CROQUDRAFT_53371 [Cronartium quercuum f. sp. fusiforme G11]